MNRIAEQDQSQACLIDHFLPNFYVNPVETILIKSKKKIQVLVDPVVVNFFGNENSLISKKITTIGSTNTCNFFDIF